FSDLEPRSYTLFAYTTLFRSALLAIPATVAVALVLVPLLVKVLDRNAGWPLAITFVALAGYALKHARVPMEGGAHRWSATWIGPDRKGTRLNSSHVSISYAAF